MSGAGRGAIVVILAALFTVGFSWKLQMDSNARLEREIDQIESRFRDMQLQHEKAIEAGEKAARARDEINSIMLGRELELEKILGACPDVSGIELDAGLRDFLRNACSGNAYAAGVPDGPDSSARPGKAEDGRRHGKDYR